MIFKDRESADFQLLNQFLNMLQKHKEQNNRTAISFCNSLIKLVTQYKIKVTGYK